LNVFGVVTAAGYGMRWGPATNRPRESLRFVCDAARTLPWQSRERGNVQPFFGARLNSGSAENGSGQAMPTLIRRAASSIAASTRRAGSVARSTGSQRNTGRDDEQNRGYRKHSRAASR